MAPSVSLEVNLPQVPEALMGRHEAFKVAPPSAVRNLGKLFEHHLQGLKKLPRHLEVGLIARMMKRDQDLVRQSAAVSLRTRSGQVALF
jgi:hypothetical protein